MIIDLKGIDLLTALVMGEAESESITGKIAVAQIVKNRLKDAKKRWPNTWEKVILQPKQFSCFSLSASWFRPTILLQHWDSLNWRECRWAAMGVFCDYVDGNDIIKNANHYHTKQVNPSWSLKKSLVVTIGNHLFYEL